MQYFDAMCDPDWVVEADFARKLESERDEARFDLEFRRRLGDQQNETINDIADARNEARGQRDRLAKVIESASVLIAAKGRHNTMLAYNGLRDALQSLTPNEPISNQ